MSSDPGLAVQQAIYSTLTGAAFQTLCGVAVGVYDHVPQGATPPYIVISDIQDDGTETQGYDGSDLHLNITIWTNRPGNVLARTLANAVRATLAPRSDLGAPLTLTGHRLISWRRTQTLVMDDADGLSVKALVKIEYATEPLTS